MIPQHDGYGVGAATTISSSKVPSELHDPFPLLREHLPISSTSTRLVHLSQPPHTVSEMHK
jgi:hypothetical protein